MLLDDNRSWVRPHFEALSAWLPVAVLETKDMFGAVRGGRLPLEPAPFERRAQGLWVRRMFAPTGKPYTLMRLAGPALARAVRDAKRVLGAARIIVAYTYPCYAPCARLHPGDKALYFAHDHFASFSRVRPRLAMQAEDAMVGEVDLAAFISRLRIEEIRSRPSYRGTPTALMAPGTDASFLGDGPQIKPAAPPADAAHIPRPMVMCVGSLSNRMDYDWLVSLIQRLPGVSFAFVGPCEDEEGVARLRACANAYLLGRKPRETLWRYMRSGDACMSPISMYNEGRYASPVRLFDYFACSRPIVSTAIREVLDFADVVFASQDVDACAGFVERVCAQGGDGREADRWALAHCHTWQARAVDWLHILVAYGLLDLDDLGVSALPPAPHYALIR